MKALCHGLIVTVMLVLSSSAVQAHTAMVYPVGGETFASGEMVTVEWAVTIDHGPRDWDLYYSDDGGANWSLVQENMPGAQLTYGWEVPAAATSTGQLKIVMDNTTGIDYEGICQVFTIEAAEPTPVPSGSPLAWGILALILAAIGLLAMRRRSSVSVS